MATTAKERLERLYVLHGELTPYLDQAYARLREMDAQLDGVAGERAAGARKYVTGCLATHDATVERAKRLRGRLDAWADVFEETGQTIERG